FHYQVTRRVSTDDNEIISVIDINSNKEISRANIFPDGYIVVENMVGLDGSDFVACTTYDASNFLILTLLNAFTGEIVATIPAILNVSDPYEPVPREVVMIENGASTKYLVFCSYWSVGTVAGSRQGIALADVTNGTLEWVVHPYQNPLAGTD